ncbi:hypothetical protein [Saccharomonospora piscinae]|uniref:hypothetical protein n=1 Tax=Saccharomonospora piscinae TaxID=687388 RepID=UPI000467306A|nr:hypothetical protein [Saccharomonospora piscinae]
MTSTDQAEPGADGARLAEEIRLLVDLVVEQARPWLDGVIQAGHGRAHGSEQSSEQAAGTDDGGCEWCPLCAVVSLCRGERVDVAARVLDHVTQLLALLRAVLADRWAPEDGVHMPGFRPPPTRSPEDERRESRVQHVVVTPASEWEPDARDRR